MFATGSSPARRCTGPGVLYADGCDRLREKLRTVSSNMLLDRGIHREIEGLLKRVGEAARREADERRSRGRSMSMRL